MDGNGKLRVIVFEVEGSTEVMGNVVDAALAMFGGARAIAGPVEAPAIPAAIAAPAVEEETVTRATPKPRVKRTVAAAPAGPARPAELGGLASEIRAVLAKRPMTSGDVIKALPQRTSGVVYQELSIMRQRRVIETREDPADGFKKNFLI
jgi:hypothetical protein